MNKQYTITKKGSHSVLKYKRVVVAVTVNNGVAIMPAYENILAAWNNSAKFEDAELMLKDLYYFILFDDFIQVHIEQSYPYAKADEYAILINELLKVEFTTV